MTRLNTPKSRTSSIKLDAAKSQKLLDGLNEELGKTNSSSTHRKRTQRSLCLFDLANPFRVQVTKIVQSRYFENFILFVILVNCILLALDEKSPTFEDSETYKVIDTAEYVFIVIFSIEMILKMIALGFVVG